MKSTKTKRACEAVIGMLVTSLLLSVAVFAQSPPAGGTAGAKAEPTPGERAIKYRQAVYTVIAGNFRPIGAMLQDKLPFDRAEALKNARRVATVAPFLDDAFPDISKQGKTRAKPEIWTNRTEFDSLVKDFNKHSAALASALENNGVAAGDFKRAATAVAKDCKTCHDKFRAD